MIHELTDIQYFLFNISYPETFVVVDASFATTCNHNNAAAVILLFIITTGCYIVF